MFFKILKLLVFSIMCGAIGYFLAEVIFANSNIFPHYDFGQINIMSLLCGIFFAVCGVYLAFVAGFDD